MRVGEIDTLPAGEPVFYGKGGSAIVQTTYVSTESGRYASLFGTEPERA